jgi:hypothetical protein
MHLHVDCEYGEHCVNSCLERLRPLFSNVSILNVVCLQKTDGLVLLSGPGSDTQELEMEALYKTFGQQRLLKRAQCLVVAFNRSGASRVVSSGRLKSLPQQAIDFDIKSPDSACRQIRQCLDSLISRLLQQKALQLEEELADHGSSSDAQDTQ